jgi:hypothetical protein
MAASSHHFILGKGLYNAVVKVAAALGARWPVDRAIVKR